MHLRHLLIYAPFALAVTACGPADTHPVDTHKDTTIEIEGFAPIKELVSDWDVRKKNSFRTLSRPGSDQYGVFHTSETFRCKNAEDRYFDVEEDDSQRLKPVISERTRYRNKPIALPSKLKALLKAVENKYVDSELSPQDAVKALIKMNPRDRTISYNISQSPIEFLQVDDGWFVAYSGIEGAGMLLWVDSDGDYRLFKGGSANHILQHNGVIYTAHGSDHMIPDPEEILSIKKTKNGFDVKRIVTPSAVMKLAVQDGKLVGALNNGIIYVNDMKSVHFSIDHDNEYRDFIAINIGILESGRAYIAGKNMIAIYDSLPIVLTPTLYAPTDCDFIFEKVTP